MDEIQRIIIERACERLVVRYTHCIDLRERAGLGELFTEDAIVEMNGNVILGREAIAGPRGAAVQLMRHVCTNVLVDVVDEANATGVAYLTAYVQPSDDTSLGLPFVLGEYHDSYRRTAEGWQIAKRTFIPTLRRPATS